MHIKFRTGRMVLLLGGLTFAGCNSQSDDSSNVALLSVFSNTPPAAIGVTDNPFVVVSSDPATTGCKINVSTTTAPLPSCEINTDVSVVAYGGALTLSWTSQNAVTAEIYPASAPGDVAAGSWSYKSYYGTDYSMKVWNMDGKSAQCFVNLKADVNDNAAPVVKSISTGASTTCAIYESGQARCWGGNYNGQLGYGHTCAILTSGNVRCWGSNFFGQLGQGNYDNIGDDELPSSIGFVGL